MSARGWHIVNDGTLAHYLPHDPAGPKQDRAHCGLSLGAGAAAGGRPWSVHHDVGRVMLCEQCKARIVKMTPTIAPEAAREIAAALAAEAAILKNGFSRSRRGGKPDERARLATGLESIAASYREQLTAREVMRHERRRHKLRRRAVAPTAVEVLARATRVAPAAPHPALIPRAKGAA